MELKDFIVTPIVLFAVYALAYAIRPRVTDSNTRRYFIPALTVKVIGAIAVGCVYQFYYGGGDTFNYFTHGSRVIWEAFMNDPVVGIKLFLNSPVTGKIYNYAHRIWFYNNHNSFAIIQIAAIFDLITFSTYSSTAILFAIFSFSGIWALYLTFYNKIKNKHLQLAIAILFIPTVFFWGSGLLKDTITLGCLGWMTFAFNLLFIQGQLKKITWFGVLVLTGWMIYSIKVYILLSFLPSLIIWLYLSKVGEIRSLVLKAMVAPILFIMALTLIYFSVIKVGEDDRRYQLDKLAETAKITAYDIGFYTGKSAGSGYNLGELDGTFAGMIRLAPQAINVSLFRPYLWEVENPLMLLSAFESLCLLCFTLYVFYRAHLLGMFKHIFKPEVAFCLFFSLIFAFAVGISTYNFGTLSRYKIPLMPYYLTGLFFILNQKKVIQTI